MSAQIASRRREPPPPLDFIVGQDSSGLWLAVETHGHRGGIFVTRDAAVRYAAGECDRRPASIRFADKPIRLRI